MPVTVEESWKRSWQWKRWWQYNESHCQCMWTYIYCSVTSTILQQSLARLFNSHWQDYSTITGTIFQQSLSWLINSGWHDSSTFTGIILLQPLVQLFNSDWHDSSTVTCTILQHSRSRFFLFSMQAEFFNSDVHCWRIVPCTSNTTQIPGGVLRKKEFFKNVAKFTGNSCARENTCELCKIFKNTTFTEQLRTTASEMWILQ